MSGGVRAIISISGKLRQYRWKPSVWMCLLVGVMFSVFVALGIWQLQRAAEKAALYASFEAGGNERLQYPPATLGDARYRSLQIEGSYVTNRQVLIDNMTQSGRVGYQVLTPFEVAGADRWLIVNRGWVLAPPSRSELPAVGVGTLMRAISGKMDRLPRPGLRLGHNVSGGENWPQVMVFPSFEDLSQALGKPLFNYQLLLDPQRVDGFARQWAPRVMGPDKHRAYAWQWFVFALVLVALFIGLNLRRGEASG